MRSARRSCKLEVDCCFAHVLRAFAQTPFVTTNLANHERIAAGCARLIRRSLELAVVDDFAIFAIADAVE